MTGPLLQVRGLRKAYGALAVTDDVSFDVQAGKIHAIIGPNGAGKTTLVAQLSGQLAPDAGQVIYDGHDITQLEMPLRVRRGLARSFQLTRILPQLSVLENVAIAVQARSGSSFRFWRPAASEVALNDQAMEYLSKVGLHTKAQLPARLLSHGEKRQLELAVALATGPRLLLLDEPLAGTGPEEAEVLVDLLDRLRSQVTMVLIEHDMGAVFRLADHISVLVYGQIIASGTPDMIRDNPKVRAAYLGEEEEPS
ncbi:ABC transporter ATP-binding protein [Paracoccus sp. JM45]|uniref:ABC transporter ATP-binding protein n=1 Tax=Paracoccus sp. JM45 TaxID=2283626 RepID=UPI000E6C4CEB|nr:ABC transporter ATP-binding protein [Paracoccus sp. JM45]RJE79256.1 ABC transporter ATP-binding protein [Paracoccus sp. JM45]